MKLIYLNITDKETLKILKQGQIKEIAQCYSEASTGLIGHARILREAAQVARTVNEYRTLY